MQLYKFCLKCIDLNALLNSQFSISNIDFYTFFKGLPRPITSIRKVWRTHKTNKFVIYLLIVLLICYYKCYYCCKSLVTFHAHFLNFFLLSDRRFKALRKFSRLGSSSISVNIIFLFINVFIAYSAALPPAPSISKSRPTLTKGQRTYSPTHFAARVAIAQKAPQNKKKKSGETGKNGNKSK